MRGGEWIPFESWMILFWIGFGLYFYRDSWWPLGKAEPSSFTEEAFNKKKIGKSFNFLILFIAIGIFSLVAFFTTNSATTSNLAPTPQQPLSVQSTSPVKVTLGVTLSKVITDFDERTGTGEIVYSSFPKNGLFEDFQNSIGKPFAISLIKTIQLEDQIYQLLFLSSKPKVKGEDDFNCHTCSPILSAMLISEDSETGFSIATPPQPIMPAGTWGEIKIDDDYAPSMVQIGPNRFGFILKHGDAAQGEIVEWGTIHSIDVDGFSNIGDFHVHSDSLGSGRCDGISESNCAQKDTRIRFMKSSTNHGLFDISVTEKEVITENGAIERAEKKYALRFNGAQYVKLP